MRPIEIEYLSTNGTIAVLQRSGRAERETSSGLRSRLTWMRRQGFSAPLASDLLLCSLLRFDLQTASRSPPLPAAQNKASGLGTPIALLLPSYHAQRYS